MKKSKLFLKITVVSGFVVLMSGFVAYKAGAFTGPPAEPGTATTDSVANNSFYIDEMMSSSKSMIVENDQTQLSSVLQDTSSKKKSVSKNQNNVNANNNASRKQDSAPAKKPYIMPSSKSAPIFVPKTEEQKVNRKK